MQLPVELVLEIGGYLQVRDRVRLARTSRYHYLALIRSIHQDALTAYVCHGKQSIPAWAVAKGHWKLLEDLLRLMPMGCEFPLEQITRILDPAALNGQLAAVQLVFEKVGGILNDENAWQALYYAAVSDHLPVAQFLAGKEIHAYTAQKKGENPMHAVAIGGNVELAKLLLRGGVTVSRETTRNGRTSIHYAAATGNLEMVELLLRVGADIFSVDQHRRTVLFNAAVAGIDDAPSTARGGRISIPKPTRGNAEVIKLLLWQGADPSPWDIRGMSVLHAVCEKGYTAELQALLGFGVDTSIRDTNGFTPLHYAVSGKSLKAMEMLLAAGADINVRDYRGRTLLHIAAIVSHAGLVKVLLSKGLDHSIKDKDGWTALHHAIYEGNPHEWDLGDTLETALDLLLEAANGKFSLPESEKPLTAHRAVENVSMLEGTDILSGSGVDFYARRQGLSALDIAVTQNDSIMTKALLQVYHVDPNRLPTAVAHDDPIYHFPPLHRACALGREEIVKLLLSAGANVDLRDYYGQTALHNAACENRKSIITLLLSGGAYSHPKDQDWRTPLHYACEFGYLEPIRILIAHLPPPKKPKPFDRIVLPTDPNFNDYDHSINSLDKERDTPLHLAVLNDRQHLIQPLLDAGADPRRHNSRNMTPLGLARENKYYRVEQVLKKALGTADLAAEDREERKRRVKKAGKRYYLTELVEIAMWDFLGWAGTNPDDHWDYGDLHNVYVDDEE